MLGTLLKRIAKQREQGRLECEMRRTTRRGKAVIVNEGELRSRAGFLADR